MTYDVEIGGRSASVSVREHPDGGWWVSIDGAPEARYRGGANGAGEWWLQDDASRRTVAVHVAGDQISAQIAGHGLHGTVVDPRDTALDALAGGSEGAVSTPMPGAIVRIPITHGQRVEVGQVLIVVEAMKMENEFKAPVAGVVAAIHVEVGAAVEANALLVTVDPEDA